MSFVHWFKRHNLDVQFAGYEGGNIIAAIAGAGGPAAFANDISTTFGDNTSITNQVYSLAANYPDATVTIGLGALVLLSPAVRKLANTYGTLAENVVDIVVSLLAMTILGYALTQDSSWITIAASSFVVASSFLRQSAENPFLLKLGGVFLTFGGLALALFGFENLQSPLIQTDVTGATMGLLTLGTGVYVAGAGLLTYEGGIFAMMGHRPDESGRQISASLAAKLLDPNHGYLPRLFSRHLDKPIQWINERAIKPAIFWVSSTTKASKPFATSMWARLPWRLMTGLAAIATGTAAGFTFAAANAGWALGDVAIGSMDWELEEIQETPSAVKVAAE